MSRVHIRVLPHGYVTPTDRVARALAVFLLVASVLFVAFAGTFPFDFAIPEGGWWDGTRRQFDWRWMQWDPGNVDRLQNVLFFVPFGFALSAVIGRRRARHIRQVISALLLGMGLSLIVELTQALVSFRDPALQDLWCNTLGSVIGAGIFIAGGDRLVRLAARGLLNLRWLVSSPILATALTIYTLLMVSAPLLIRRPGDLSVWDTGMLLTVGDHAANDRPWDGFVSEIVLADRAVEAEQAQALAAGAAPADLLGESLLGQYVLRGPAPYPDLTGKLKPLNWMGQRPDELEVSSTGPPHLYSYHWLATGASIAPAIHRIRSSGELSLAFVAATANTRQHGPARIVTISNRRGFNLAVGQEDSDLTVRLRSAIRTSPDLHVRDVLADFHAHHILLTHRNGQIRVYVDGLERGRVEITPEAKIIWRLYPRNWFRLRMERYGLGSYATIYRVMALVPFAALLTATLATSTLSMKHRRTAAAGAALLVAVLLEIILGLESASGFQLRNLLISIIVAFATLAAMEAWRARSPQSSM
ncbi:VanZ family protein [Fontivita pretiosa]|uniref:VanZ family protein n=1 Tax=Fontivita pretiosa TaxID=2989684 RepID=UPI003D16825B